MTSLEIETENFALQLQLISEMSQRERSLIARSFFQWVKPWLDQITRVTHVSIDHTGHAALAGAVGIQRSHLSALERGLYRPKSETLTRIWKILTDWAEDERHQT